MTEASYYVYRHLKKDTSDVFYIGRSMTKNFKRAYALQCSQRNTRWCEINSEFGTKVEIVCEGMSNDDSAELEEFLIYIYGREDLKTGLLVNKCNGGKTSKGMIRSEEYRKNQSENLKGKYIAENNPFYSKSHTEETLIKMRKPRESLKNGGHFRSKEVINTITSVIYSNVRIASEMENVLYSSLRGYLRGAQPNKTAMLYLEVVEKLKDF